MIDDNEVLFFFPEECRSLRSHYFSVWTWLRLSVILCHKAECFSAGSSFNPSEDDNRCQVRYQFLILTILLAFLAFMEWLGATVGAKMDIVVLDVNEKGLGLVSD